MDSATSALAAWLRDHTRFQELVRVAACRSTQWLAQQHGAGQEPASAVFWADHQTHGRGREGRRWHDTPGQDLAVTFALRGMALQNPTHLAAGVPVAIARTLERHLGEDDARAMLQIKWPNDILLRGRKISGLLIDSLGGRGNTAHLVGIGINVNRTSFPEELAVSATSLALATGTEFDRVQVLRDLARELEAVLAALEARGSGGVGPLEDAFRARLKLIGRKVRLQAGGADREGRLEHMDFDTVQLAGESPVPLAHVQRLDGV